MTVVKVRSAREITRMIADHNWYDHSLRNESYESLAAITSYEAKICDRMVTDDRMRTAHPRQVAVIQRAKEIGFKRARELLTEKDGVYHWMYEGKEIRLVGKLIPLDQSEGAEWLPAIADQLGVQPRDLFLIRQEGLLPQFARRLFIGLTRAVVVRIVNNRYLRLWVVVSWW